MIVTTETEAVWLVKIELASILSDGFSTVGTEFTCDFIVVEMQYIIFAIDISTRACSKKIQSLKNLAEAGNEYNQSHSYPDVLPTLLEEGDYKHWTRDPRIGDPRTTRIRGPRTPRNRGPNNLALLHFFL